MLDTPVLPARARAGRRSQTAWSRRRTRRRSCTTTCPTDDLIAYHRARAAGGAGLIVVEATAVHPTGLLTAHTVGGYLPADRARLPADGRRRPGARHAARLPALPRRARDDRLGHRGRRRSRRARSPRRGSRPSRARSPWPRSPRCSTATGRRPAYAGRGRPRRRRGVRRLRLPADPVPVARTRTSAPTRTAASFENRLRFLREVLEAMREGFGPDGAVGCRLTDESSSSVGTDSEDVLAAAAAVGDDGLADYISVTLGLVADVPRLDVDRAAVAGGPKRDRRVRAAGEGADGGAGDRHRARCSTRPTPTA